MGREEWSGKPSPSTVQCEGGQTEGPRRIARVAEADLRTG